jgi:hypothetical protein
MIDENVSFSISTFSIEIAVISTTVQGKGIKECGYDYRYN